MPDNANDERANNDYLWDRSGTPDAEVARLEKLLAPLAHDAPLDELRLKRRRVLPWIAIGIAVAAAAAAVLYFALPRSGGAHTCRGTSGFAFAGDGGDVACGGARLASGVLPVGGLLDTGAHEASLTIADIGTARLGTNTRVRLERTDAQRHQLELVRGSMHAKVNAPPRLFAVTTKHTDVVDLGCEYTIAVDDDGAGSISVQSGIVELAAKNGALVVAPAGSSAALLAGQRPGLPVGDRANERVKAAVEKYDRGEAGALDALLDAAQDRDAITLAALYRIDEAHRAKVLLRLYDLSPPPDAEITPDSVADHPKLFDIWARDIVEVYLGVYAHPR